jgi:putative FmdB family regulatory protein
VPLYEYRCKECDERFESQVTYSQADSVQCDACGSTRVHRMVASIPANNRDPRSGGAGELTRFNYNFSRSSPEQGSSATD